MGEGGSTSLYERTLGMFYGGLDLWKKCYFAVLKSCSIGIDITNDIIFFEQW
jgi:hypothetical protein